MQNQIATCKLKTQSRVVELESKLQMKEDEIAHGHEMLAAANAACKRLETVLRREREQRCEEENTHQQVKESLALLQAHATHCFRNWHGNFTAHYIFS